LTNPARPRRTHRGARASSDRCFPRMAGRSRGNRAPEHRPATPEKFKKKMRQDDDAADIASAAQGGRADAYIGDRRRGRARRRWPDSSPRAPRARVVWGPGRGRRGGEDEEEAGQAGTNCCGAARPRLVCSRWFWIWKRGAPPSWVVVHGVE
jgi:hypothetical protein